MGIEGNRKQTGEVDFANLIHFYRRNRKIVVCFVAVTTLCGVLVTITKRPVYGARAIIMTSPEAETNMALLMVRDRGGPLQVLKGILESESSTAMIAKRAKVSKDDVRKNLSVKADSLVRQLSLSSKDLDTEGNLSLVRAAHDVLRERSREFGFSVATMQVSELEKTLRDRLRELRAAEDSLVSFTKEMKTGPDARPFIEQLRTLELEKSEVDRQYDTAVSRARASIQKSGELPTTLPQAEQWRQKVVDIRLRIALASQKFGPEAREMRALKMELDETERAFRAEAARYAESLGLNLDPVTADLAGKRMVLGWQLEEVRQRASIAPIESVEYSRRAREVQALSEVTTQLRKELEANRIKARVENVQFLTLDAPHIEDVPSNKSLSSAIVKFGLLGFFAGSLISLVLGRRRL